MGGGRAEANVSGEPLRADWKRAADGIGMVGCRRLPAAQHDRRPALVVLGRRDRALAAADHVGRDQDRLRADAGALAGAARARARARGPRLGGDGRARRHPRRTLEGRGPASPARGRQAREAGPGSVRLAAAGGLARARGGRSRRRALDRAARERQPRGEARGRDGPRASRLGHEEGHRRAAGTPAALGAGRAERAAARLRAARRHGPEQLRPDAQPPRGGRDPGRLPDHPAHAARALRPGQAAPQRRLQRAAGERAAGHARARARHRLPLQPGQAPGGRRPGAPRLRDHRRRRLQRGRRRPATRIQGRSPGRRRRRPRPHPRPARSPRPSPPRPPRRRPSADKIDDGRSRGP